MTLPTPSLLLIGHCGRDRIFRDGIEKRVCFAGSAYYAGIGASRFCKNTAIATCIGGHDEDLFNAILALGVNVDGVSRSFRSPSSEFRLYYRYDEESESLLRSVAMLLSCGQEIDISGLPDNFYSARYVHICTAPPRQQLQWIERLRNNQTNKVIGYDTVEDFLTDSLEDVISAMRRSDIVFLNARESHLINQIKRTGQTVIIKKGADGAEIWKNNELQISVPAPEVNFVDSTGSGDILAGAFMGLLSLGKDEVTCLKSAVNLASSSVTCYGVGHLIHR
jgi:sugar/nucleoside kinase (ribokinase family)